jgi:MFS superfamily sulfate permease-like transporter
MNCFIRRSYRCGLPVILLTIAIGPAQAQNVEEVATTFFGDLQNVLQGISLAAAAVSLLTLGMIYLLSTWPPVAQYKAQHPDLMQNIIVGLLIILFVSGGTLAGLIAFQ